MTAEMTAVRAIMRIEGKLQRRKEDMRGHRSSKHQRMRRRRSPLTAKANRRLTPRFGSLKGTWRGRPARWMTSSTKRFTLRAVTNATSDRLIRCETKVPWRSWSLHRKSLILLSSVSGRKARLRQEFAFQQCLRRVRRGLHRVVCLPDWGAKDILA